MTIRVNTSHTAREQIVVNYHPAQQGGDYAVQVFLGSSYDTLYMSVEDAREFADSLRAALPAVDRRLDVEEDEEDEYSPTGDADHYGSLR